MRHILTLLLIATWILTGCETESETTVVAPDSTSSDSADRSEESSDTPDIPSASNFSYDTVIWGGESYGGATSVDMTLSSASVDGSYIHFEYEMNNSWPTTDGLQAVACMFVKRSDGSWYGGKFDWIREGGQTVKLTENIDNGYGAFSSEQPAPGQTVAFIWVSVDKKHRSNEAVTTWE